MRLLTACLALLSLTACTVATSNATADSAGTGPCRNEPLRQFTGQPASQALGERILRASGSRTIRWVPKGGVITMDFNPDRVTVQLDGDSKVETARCG